MMRTRLELEKDFENIVGTEVEEGDLSEDKKKKISYLLSLVGQNISEVNTSQELYHACENLSTLTQELDKIKEDVEYEEFVNSGKVLDFKRLKEKWRKKKLGALYKTFDWEKFEEIIKNPPTKILNWDGKTYIHFDKFYVRKTLTAIVQMVLDQMDIWICNVGAEGSGKSCWSSQQIRFIYHILREFGLTQDDYDVKRMFFSAIDALLEAQDSQGDQDYFKIFCLDEGYELNRQNFREESSILFKDDMRSNRKMLRVNLINLPQLGELEVAITLSRMNFIYFCEMSYDPFTQTLKKGEVQMYVVPRGKQIYSKYHKKNLTKKEIKQKLGNLLKDKESYYVEMPEDIMIHKFEFEEVWGFDVNKYSSHIKKSNRKRRMKGHLTLTDYQQYILWQKIPKLSKLGTFDTKNPRDAAMKDVLRQLLKKIERRFLDDPQAYEKVKYLYDSEFAELKKQK